MTRLIIILLAIFLALTFLRSFVKRYRIYSGSLKKEPKEPDVAKDKKKDDDNIIDAKFEEIK